MLAKEASLQDVTFVDDRIGWAVGDRGLILRTTDGGATWRRQDAETDALLSGVWFADERVGYVVGGQALPAGRSCGVLLTTTDGGVRWRHVDASATGHLRAVWADPSRKGWALGEAGPMRSSGLWRFDAERGRLHGEGDRDVPGILGASFRADGRGLAVGRDGACIILRRGELTPQRRAVAFGGRLTGVTQITRRQACMVGDDATIFTSDNGGRSWSVAEVAVPAGVRELVDLTDVAFADESHGWAVGPTGPYVLSTRDGGRTWQVKATALPWPLRGIAALDRTTLVGVGQGGLIARSADGGSTWQAVHGGQTGTAVLVLTAASADWPWRLMPILTGRYRCRTSFVSLTDDGFSQASLHAAATASGAIAPRRLTDFPGDVVGEAAVDDSATGNAAASATDRAFAAWSDRLDRDAARSMRNQIIGAVRSLHPMVVIVDGVSAARDPVRAAITRVALEALDRSGRDDVEPEQTRLGLSPYRAERVVCMLDGDRRQWHAGSGSDAVLIEIGSSTERRELLGMTERMASLRALAALGRPIDDRPSRHLLEIVRGEVPTRRKDLGLLSGLQLDSSLRYPVVRSDVARSGSRDDELRSALQTVAGLAEHTGDPTRLVRLAVQALDHPGLSVEAADALYRAARLYEMSGRHRQAEAVWRAFIDRGRDHPAWADVVVTESVRSASAETYMASPVRPEDPLAAVRTALARLDYLCAERPALRHSPPLLFARGHGHRVLGRLGSARRFYGLLAASDAPGWSQAAQAELWLLDSPGARDAACPRRLLTAPQLDAPIDVDGRLDEPPWQHGMTAALEDAGGEPVGAGRRTKIHLAWDAAHLYFGAEVATTHGRSGPPRGQRPRRDWLAPDWPAIELLLDVDRDAADTIRIAVDELGNGLDAHGSDLSWTFPMRPTPLAGSWHYSVMHGAAGWTLEMAVPMKSIFPRAIVPGQVWAIQILRRDPSAEPQWLTAQPGQEPSPQHFALLMFDAVR